MEGKKYCQVCCKLTTSVEENEDGDFVCRNCTEEVEDLDFERELDRDDRNSELQQEIGPGADAIYGPNS